VEIHRTLITLDFPDWIPAFAGMTKGEVPDILQHLELQLPFFEMKAAQFCTAAKPPCA
jgi:hypothetical protein